MQDAVYLLGVGIRGFRQSVEGNRAIDGCAGTPGGSCRALGIRTGSSRFPAQYRHSPSRHRHGQFGAQVALDRLGGDD